VVLLGAHEIEISVAFYLHRDGAGHVRGRHGQGVLYSGISRSANVAAAMRVVVFITVSSLLNPSSKIDAETPCLCFVPDRRRSFHCYRHCQHGTLFHCDYYIRLSAVLLPKRTV